MRWVVVDRRQAIFHDPTADVVIPIGATARSDAENAVQIGPVSRLVRKMGPEHLPDILDAVERALVPLAALDGHVSLSGPTWIVSAKNPT